MIAYFYDASFLPRDILHPIAQHGAVVESYGRDGTHHRLTTVIFVVK